MHQLQRISDGVVFDVLGTKISGRGELRADGSGAKHPNGDVVWLQQLGSPHGPFGHGNDHLRQNFRAYPPQEQPDRVDRLAQETDGWEPLKAYTVAFCPVDDKPLEPGHRVVEAYAGALVDARKCPTCGRFFEDNYLAEIKIWKD
jgi:hypothetical protein